LVPDAPYRRQLFVCTYGAWCRLEGSEEIRDALKAKVKAAGLDKELRVTKSGCFGQCGHGPMMVAWPENVWYRGVALADVDEIVASHLVGGAPVERLRYRPAKAGSNKTPEVQASEAASRKED
jgi:(2Fe-2S) ferredoxin